MDRIPLLRRSLVGPVTAVVLVLATAASASPESDVVLRIRTNGVVSGSDGLRCAGRCWIPFTRGALVTLRASPPRHFEFAGWSGGCVGAAPTCVLALDTSVPVRASFRGKPTTVSLSVGGPGTVVSSPKGIECGGGHSDCDAEFPWGTQVRLRARPTATGAFASWGGACWKVRAGGCTVSLRRDFTTVGALFRHSEPVPGLQRLTVEAFGTRVNSKPAGIDCPMTCTATFASGTRVRLETAGRFAGACVSRSLDRCLLVLDAPTKVTAVPNAPHSVTTDSGYGMRVSVSGRGTVTAPGIRCGGQSGTLSDCDNFFSPKSVVVLNARAAKNGQFLGWSFFCKGTKPKCTVFIATATIVAARFRL